MDAERNEEEAEEDVGDGEEGSDGLAWKDFFGSSVSLAPSLLSIFDRQVAATCSETGSPRIGGAASAYSKDEPIDHNSSQPTFPDAHDIASCSANNGQANGLLEFADNNNSNVQMLSSLCVGRSETDSDLKKRPLSLRSTSSNSSSSLSLQPHQRKKIARDAAPLDKTGSPSSLDKTGTPTLSVFSDSRDPSVACGNLHNRNGVSRHNREAVKRSEPGETGWSLNRFGQDGRVHLLAAENEDGFLCMDVDQDLEWSHMPSTGKVVSEKRLSALHRTDSNSYSDRVVLEIVETEQAYVRDLQDIIQGYIEHVRSSPGLLCKSDADILFGNIEDIYRFHSEFLRKLEKSGTDPVKIAECFVQSSDGFTIYSDYCTNYPRAVGVLTRCMQTRRIAETLKKQQMSLQHGLPLGSYLLKPVQRILKYHLLLQNLLNNYGQSGSDHDTISQALGSMMSVAQRINEMKRAHERSVRIQEIQSLLYDWSRVDLNSYGDLVLEDQFQMFGAKAFRLIWVFRKAVVIAKKKEDETIQIKTAIMFSNLMLIETIPRAPLNFHLIPFDNPKVQYTVQARSMDQKRHWCQEIKRLILETYEAVIPEKARQLVMMLGKEDESENSTNTAGSENVPSEPVKNSGILERRKGRQRSVGFIPDLGILKSKKGTGTKADSPGTATPESDSVWNGSVNDVLSQKPELKSTVSESFCQDVDQKTRTLHTSFSLQNIRNPLAAVPPLRKLSGSEGNWHSESNGDRYHQLHTRKLLTAESVDEEFSDSDPHLKSSQGSSDWLSFSLSKPRTPAISEETLPCNNRHHPSLKPSSSLCSGNNAGLLQSTSVRHISPGNNQHSSDSDFHQFDRNKVHGAVSLDADRFVHDHNMSDYVKKQNAVSNPMFFEDRACSSDSLMRNSGVIKSLGNVFVDRTAFLVSESVGCVGSNRLLDRRLARLCTPPRELGSPALVHDVKVSKERGKAVVHYGTPMRTVEFPDDICGGKKLDISGCLDGEIRENPFRSQISQDNLRIGRAKTAEFPMHNGSLEILHLHPKRSTSVQEEMAQSCGQVYNENATKLKPKRSDSFHGNSVYSTTLQPNHLSSKSTATGQKSPVSSLKNTLLGWTEKLTKRRSHSTDEHVATDPGGSLAGDETSNEKVRLKPGLLVSRLARASYRKLKREKSTENVDAFETTSSEPSETILEEVRTIPKQEEEKQTSQFISEGSHFLSSYALTTLPKQNRDEKEIVLNNGSGCSVPKVQQVNTKISNLPRDTHSRRPQSCRSVTRRQTVTNIQPQRMAPDGAIYRLRYIDDDAVSIISERNEENSESGESAKATNASPIKNTKSCSVLSLPGARNGYLWSSSLCTINQGDNMMPASISTEGRLNCFTAPRGHWIPYIDDSGDDD